MIVLEKYSMIQKQPFGKERSEKYRKIRSSRPEVFCINGVLRNFGKFTGKPVTLLKKRLSHRCLPVNFAKFLRIPFLQNTSDGCFCKIHACELYNILEQIINKFNCERQEQNVFEKQLKDFSGYE